MSMSHAGDLVTAKNVIIIYLPRLMSPVSRGTPSKKTLVIQRSLCK